MLKYVTFYIGVAAVLVLVVYLAVTSTHHQQYFRVNSGLQQGYHCPTPYSCLGQLQNYGGGRGEGAKGGGEEGEKGGG